MEAKTHVRKLPYKTMVKAREDSVEYLSESERLDILFSIARITVQNGFLVFVCVRLNKLKLNYQDTCHKLGQLNLHMREKDSVQNGNDTFAFFTSGTQTDPDMGGIDGFIKRAFA